MPPVKFFEGQLVNPNQINEKGLTGTIIDTTKHAPKTIEDFKSQGFQTLQKKQIDGGDLFFTETDPNTGKRFETFVQRPKKVIGVDNTNKIVGGSQNIRDKINIINNEINNLPEDDGKKTDIKVQLQSLIDTRNNINKISDSELESINRAGENAGSAFDAQIAAAREEGRQGLASATVGAGRRGGLMRARFAGEAALGPTVGNTYVGAGGKLEQLSVAYQRRVDALIAEKERAILLAKQAQRKAIQSGKTADFNAVRDIINLARQLDNDARQAENDRNRLALDVQKEKRLSDRLFFDMNKFSIGEERLRRSQDLIESKFNYQVSNDLEQKALENIKVMANSGIDINSLSDEQIRQMEYESGLPAGTFEAFYEQLQAEKAQGLFLNDLKIQKAKADIANVYSNINKRNKLGIQYQASEGFKDIKTELRFRKDSADILFYYKDLISKDGLDPDTAIKETFNELRVTYPSYQVSDDAIINYITTGFGISPAGVDEIEPLPGEIGETEDFDAQGNLKKKENQISDEDLVKKLIGDKKLDLKTILK